MRKVIFTLLLLLLCNYVFSQCLVDTSLSIKTLLHSFVGTKGGIKLSNIHYTGEKSSIGYFYNSCKRFPLKSGIILSTGNAMDATGPNDKGNCGRKNYAIGDSDLEKLAKGRTFDAAALSFDFMANSDSISFDYVFASEEYPEFVNKGLNDIFAFIISDSTQPTKRNIALCNNTPISVNNINASKNALYFIANNEYSEMGSNCLSSSLQFDGMTVKLSAGIKLKPYVIYHFKICLADVDDGFYDSAVMLRSNSFVSAGIADSAAAANIVKSVLKDNYFNIITNSTGIYCIPNIEFDFDSFTLPNNSVPVLQHLVQLMNSLFDYKIEICGFADNVGSDAYNTTLSLKRAQAVADFLLQNKIEKKRITVQGLGNSNPLASNNTVAGRIKNRRVSVRFYK